MPQKGPAAVEGPRIPSRDPERGARRVRKTRPQDEGESEPGCHWPPGSAFLICPVGTPEGFATESCHFVDPRSIRPGVGNRESGATFSVITCRGVVC